MAQRMVEQPVMVTVTEVKPESADTVTLWLQHTMEFDPGQFIMVWLPRMDEKPYTVSAFADGRMAITVRQRGKFSKRLTEMRPGDQLGVRGPYGHGFSPKKPFVIVAGGCGVAPVAVLKERNPDAPLILGAKTADELIFSERFSDAQICTDDGSAGHHGFPTELLEPMLEPGALNTVCVCGPEVMMCAVFTLCESRDVECQAGLERYMKCGFGVCGQCTCGDRLVCKDGPVFGSEDLRRMADFGHTARLKSGRKVTLQEYTDGCGV